VWHGRTATNIHSSNSEIRDIENVVQHKAAKAVTERTLCQISRVVRNIRDSKSTYFNYSQSLSGILIHVQEGTCAVPTDAILSQSAMYNQK
jgi:hypothetical protein